MKKRMLGFLLAAAMFAGISADVNVPLTDITISASAASSSKLKVPSGITTSSKSDSISLKWKKVSGADGYRVYMYSPDSDEYEKYKDVTGTECTVKDLKSGRKYKFKVAALVKKNGKKSVQTKSGKIEVSTSKGSSSKTTMRTKAGEWKMPAFGTKMSTALKDCGIANYREYENSVSKYSYMGEILIDGDPHILSIHFNSDKKFCIYYVYRAGIKKEFDSMLKQYTDKYGKSYQYIDGVYAWEAPSDKIVVLVYFADKGLLGYGEGDAKYMEISD